MKTPYFSLIIPVYNCAEYLKSCIGSIQTQSFPDLEIICINDGSTDDSLKVLQELAEADDRIVVIDQKNAGVSAARNAGIQKARGKYLYMMDSDDSIVPGALERMHEECEKNQLDVLHIGYSIECQKPEYANVMIKKPHSYKDGMPSEVLPGIDFLEAMINHKIHMSTVWTYVFNREYLAQSGARFQHMQAQEDTLFTPLALMHAKRVKAIEDDLYVHFIREASLMTTLNAHKRIRNCVYIISEQIKNSLSLKDIDLRKSRLLAKEASRLSAYTHRLYKALPKEDRSNIFDDEDPLRWIFEALVQWDEENMV